jgi:pimeloyl-ACP methyl ester carboxylesterase
MQQRIALFLLINASPLMEALQIIQWGKCPSGQMTSSFNMDCANLTFPLNYNNPTMGNVNAFIRRQYVNNPTSSAIWCLAGGPGDSTYGFPPICDYFIGSNSSFTCYSQDARGTGLSSYMSCDEEPVGPFNPYNTTSVKSYENCFQNIIDTYGSDVQYYSTYNAQRDLLGAIQAIDPEVVHIYAQSFGTYAINTYLQLPGARADVVVLDGPVPPNRWPLENNGGRPIT